MKKNKPFCIKDLNWRIRWPFEHLDKVNNQLGQNQENGTKPVYLEGNWNLSRIYFLQVSRKYIL